MEQAHRLVPVMFLVIIGTVAIYGLGAAPLAHRLGLAVRNPEGVLIVGAHRFGRALAAALKEGGVRAMVADTNIARIRKARMEGIDALHANLLAEDADEHLDLPGIGRLFALTPNREVNALIALHYVHLFGRREVYQLAAGDDGSGGPAELPAHLRARTLFGEELDYDALLAAVARGAVIKATKITEQFDFDAWRARHGDDAIPLLVLGAESRMTVATVDAPLAPADGDTLVALVNET
jgi:CPA1 family monovalent cation:H+ antiporter